MKRYETKFLFLVLFLSAFLRFAWVNYSPPSLNWDEISHGYNAYSLLKTGKDEWGQTLPLIFRAYGDYKLPVYIYLTVFSELFFGLTLFAVRLPSILAGIATVVFTYLLVKKLFKRSNLALISAILVSIEPWSLFLSRAAFEANLAITFVVGGVFLFIKSLRSHRYLVLSVLFFGLSVWTYNSARVFVPLLLLVLAFIYREDLRGFPKRLIGSSILLLGLFFLPMFWQLVNPVGQARYSEVAIINQGSVNQIIEKRVTKNLPEVLERAIYNRPVYFVSEVVKNYFKHFSPRFLFLEGGSQYQFSVQGWGVIYLLNAPFLVLGLLYLVRRRSKSGSLLLAWFLLSPIASSLTREAPHVLRTSVMIPVPMILSAIGAVSILDWLKSKRVKNGSLVLATLYFAALVFSTKSYMRQYLTKYRETYSWSWQYGYKEVVEYAGDHYGEYDKIVMTKKYGEPHEFVLFYNKWDPKSYRNDPSLVRFAQSNWFWVDGFDKYYFVNDWQVRGDGVDSEVFKLESGGEVDCNDLRCLLMTSPGNVPEGWQLVKTVNFLDGQAAFELYVN